MSSDHDSAGAPTGAEAPAETPERWSAQRKTELVVRLLRGEPLDAVARDSQVPAHELEDWRRVFLDRGNAEFEEARRSGGTGIETRPGEARRSHDAARARRRTARKKRIRGGAAEARAM